MKSKRVNVKLTVTIDTSFWSYGEKEDKRIVKHIQRWVRDTLEMDCSYIPIYPESEKEGIIEDSTYKSKIRVELK